MTAAGAVRDFRRLLALAEAGPDHYIGSAPGVGIHLFGGLLFGLAVRAGYQTVPDDRSLHVASIQFFGRAVSGDPLDYHVERLSDGGSFSSRRMTLSVKGVTVLGCDASFATPDPEVDWQPAPPADDFGTAVDVPAPLGMAGLDPAETRSLRTVVTPGRDLMHPMWARSHMPLGRDRSLHHAALAFLTDLCTLWLARVPATNAYPHREFRATTTLNHTLWLHRSLLADDWLRFDGAPVSFQDARGLAIGSVHRSDGALVATFAQEALHRFAPSDPPPGGRPHP